MAVFLDVGWFESAEASIIAETCSMPSGQSDVPFKSYDYLLAFYRLMTTKYGYDSVSVSGPVSYDSVSVVGLDDDALYSEAGEDGDQTDFDVRPLGRTPNSGASVSSPRLGVA